MLPLGNLLKNKWSLPCVFAIMFLALGVAIMLTGFFKSFESNDKSVIDLHLNNGLVFQENGTFKISIFADLHYGEAAWEAWGPAQDVNSSRVMDFILDTEKPDFVIYLGDVITANNLVTANASCYWDKAITPTAKRSIPWAAVLGNHDDAAFEWPAEWFGPAGIPGFHSYGKFSSQKNLYFSGTTRADLMNHEAQQSLSFSLTGPDYLWPSVSNFFVRISSSKKGSSAGAFLYFLDSGGGSYPEVISANQATWFQRVAFDNNPDGRTPEVVFWHIPSQAFNMVSPEPNNPISSPCFGTINLETVASQSGEWGIMNILKNRPSVKAVIVGHNHGLDWCCPFEKLWLCFARHTGYGGYGTWTRGARILELYDNPFQIKTWILLENRTKTSERFLYP